MRAIAAVAVVALAASCLHTHAKLTHAHLLLQTLDIPEDSPARRLLTCSEALGPSKCLSALSVWRSQHAFEALQTGRAAQFDLRADVEQFPWERYSNASDERLFEQLSEGTEKLLRYRSLALDVPGYSLQLESKGNGTLNVDVFKNDDGDSERGLTKKYMKDFYNVLPLMMIPGLIMSAILPFVLPALKMMTVAVGMLNNMALSGAVFTLLRNNAFNDHYEKKVIYVNEGYKNEKFSPLYFKNLDLPLHGVDIDYSGSASNVHPVVQPLTGPGGNLANFNPGQDFPSADWINQYYGNFDDAVAAAVAAPIAPPVATPVAEPAKLRRSSITKFKHRV